MENRKVSFFDAIGMTKPSSVEPLLKESEPGLNAKIMRLSDAYGAPQTRQRFEAAEIVAAWHRILGVQLDTETTARHLARLEQVLGSRKIMAAVSDNQLIDMRNRK